MTRPRRILAAGAALLVAVGLLASCATRITFDPLDEGASQGQDDASIRVTATASASGEFWMLRVPDSRPASGIDVDSPRGPFRVPPGHYPPAGQCRIWQQGVPPGHQDPPGDCDRLERQVPPGALLIYG